MKPYFTSAFAIRRIREILNDDKNYQSDALKLGGIWNWCDVVAEFRRFECTTGSAIEVIERDKVKTLVPQNKLNVDETG